MNSEEDIAWYHDITRTEAEELLTETDVEGSFLVRRSGSSSCDFVLSVLQEDNEVAHFQIRRLVEDPFFSLIDNIKVHGLDGLIEHYQESPTGINGVLLKHPVKGEFPPVDTRRHGKTNLLHRATSFGNYTVVTELLRSGYRHESKNQKGQTAVHLASMYGHNEILQALITFGANVNSHDCNSYTPLHYACQNNFVSTVKLLIREGKANIQARRNDKWVPMHEAANSGHKEVLQELLVLNAPLRPRTKENETPYHLANDKGHIECAGLLEQYKTPAPKTSRSIWYHGTLDRQESERDISNYGKKNGTFLVRYSTRNHDTVLTLYADDLFFHYIVRKEDKYYCIDDGPYLDSLEHVIEYYTFLPDGLPTTLQIPVPPKRKPPVPECKTIPRQKKKALSTTPGTSTDSTTNNNQDAVQPSHISFDSIKFSSNLELNGTNNNIADYRINVDKRKDYIFKEELKLLEILGTGEFGSAWKGKYCPWNGNGDEIDVAIKSLHNEQIETNRDAFLSEAEVMMQLNHHCIVKLIGVSLGPPLYMVQELMIQGSMLNYIITCADKINPEHEFVIWAAQIACGMQYLEQERFVHRDLAARNILLASVNQAKISDFGLSRALGSEHNYYRAKTGGKWPLKWYAPESFNYGTFSHKSDVWSFGVTIWEMYSFGQHPYNNMKGSEAIELILRGERLEKPVQCPDHIYKIMHSCWELEAEHRPTFDELFNSFSKDTTYINIKELIAERNLP